MVVFSIEPEAIDETARLVVVALVVVALRPVKFCNVDEPFAWRLDKVVRPPVAVRVPVKLAALDMVCELMRPEVMVFEPRLRAPDEVMAPRVEAPAVKLVAVKLEAKALVEEAVVAKKAVEVANVVVARRPVKSWRVVEPVWSAFNMVTSPPVAVSVVPPDATAGADRVGADGPLGRNIW